MLTNPKWRCNPTEKDPLFVCPGDLLELRGETLEVISQHTGSVWIDGDQWAGDVLLAEPSADALAYVPPHLRLLNRVIHGA